MGFRKYIGTTMMIIGIPLIGYGLITEDGLKREANTNRIYHNQSNDTLKKAEEDSIRKGALAHVGGLVGIFLTVGGALAIRADNISTYLNEDD